MIIIAALVLAVGGVGLWLAFTESEVEVAQGLADEFIAGWNADDGEAVAALFTEDGYTFDPGGGTISGREALARDVASRGAGTSDYERIGPVTETDAGTFLFTIEFRWGNATYTGEIEMMVEDGLIAWMRTEDWEVQR